MNKELFYSELSKDLKKKFGTSVEKALPWQQHPFFTAHKLYISHRKHTHDWKCDTFH